MLYLIFSLMYVLYEYVPYVYLTSYLEYIIVLPPPKFSP